MRELEPRSSLKERSQRSTSATPGGRPSQGELSPEELASTQKPTAPSPGRRNFIAAGILAIALAIGGGYAATEFWQPQSPHVGITTTTGLGVPYGGGTFLASDSLVTAKQWQERAAAFEQFKAKGPVVLDRAEPSTVGAFVAQAVANPQLREGLMRQISDKQIDMVAIGLYDDCAEDGDVVNVRSGPVNVFVPLKHQVQYVLVPVPHGGSAQVLIGGQSDGQGGGITVGMVTPGDVEHLPRLDPGGGISFSVK